ncbi:Protein Phosphatase 1 Regulatory Subunit 14A [Manis pentadactyla]|nr:Protein Phosphatase 1 Regulatory Subunit 14A [Manis pentadactyla]
MGFIFESVSSFPTPSFSKLEKEVEILMNEQAPGGEAKNGSRRDGKAGCPGHFINEMLRMAEQVDTLKMEKRLHLKRWRELAQKKGDH